MEVETLSQRGNPSYRCVCLSAKCHSSFKKKKVKHMAWANAHGARYEGTKITEQVRIGSFIVIMNIL